MTKTAPEDLLPPAPYKNTPKRWADVPRRKKVLFIIGAPFRVLGFVADVFDALS
jgi:hypothetical protein